MGAQEKGCHSTRGCRGHPAPGQIRVRRTIIYDIMIMEMIIRIMITMMI